MFQKFCHAMSSRGSPPSACTAWSNPPTCTHPQLSWIHIHTGILSLDNPAVCDLTATEIYRQLSWIKLCTYFFATIIKIDFLNVYVSQILLMCQSNVTVITVITVITFTAFFAKWHHCLFTRSSCTIFCWIVHYRAQVIFTYHVGLVDILNIKIFSPFFGDVFGNDLHMFVSVWPSVFMPESHCMHQLVYDSE